MHEHVTLYEKQHETKTRITRCANIWRSHIFLNNRFSFVYRMALTNNFSYKRDHNINSQDVFLGQYYTIHKSWRATIQTMNENCCENIKIASRRPRRGSLCSLFSKFHHTRHTAHPSSCNFLTKARPILRRGSTQTDFEGNEHGLMFPHENPDEIKVVCKYNHQGQIANHSLAVSYQHLARFHIPNNPDLTRVRWTNSLVPVLVQASLALKTTASLPPPQIPACSEPSCIIVNKLDAHGIGSVETKSISEPVFPCWETNTSCVEVQDHLPLLCSSPSSRICSSNNLVNDNEPIKSGHVEMQQEIACFKSSSSSLPPDTTDTTTAATTCTTQSDTGVSSMNSIVSAVNRTKSRRRRMQDILDSMCDDAEESQLYHCQIKLMIYKNKSNHSCVGSSSRDSGVAILSKERLLC